MVESVSVFDWVANLSPWWWVAFGIGLGAVEMATMSFFLIGPAVAALIMALVAGFGVPMSGGVLVSVWAILSVGLTFLGRSVMRRHGDGGGPAGTLNSRSAQLVGRTAKVLEWDADVGSVEVDGVRWRAVSHPGARYMTDAAVRITGADGMTLTVSDA